MSEKVKELDEEMEDLFDRLKEYAAELDGEDESWLLEGELDDD